MTQSAMRASWLSAESGAGEDGGAGAGCALVRHRARAIEAEQRGIGRLVPGDVLAGGLPKCFRAALDVEDIVDDLERETDLACPMTERP